MDGDRPKILLALIKEQNEQRQPLRKSIPDINLPQLSNPFSSTTLASFKLGQSIDAASPLYLSLIVCPPPGSILFYPFHVTDVTRSATRSVAAIYDKLAADVSGNFTSSTSQIQKGLLQKGILLLLIFFNISISKNISLVEDNISSDIRISF